MSGYAGFTLGHQIEKLTGFYHECVSLNPKYLSNYYWYCAQQRQIPPELLFHEKLKNNNPDHKEQALEYATIQTQYISIYRIHPKKYFLTGYDFPKNWDSERKISKSERYSPIGVGGHVG